MSEASSAKALLLTAVQDLHDAEKAMVERLPALRDHVSDAVLRDCLDADHARSRAQAGRLAAIAGRLDGEPCGAPNIWLRAILDDAGRDTKTIAAGPLLDIALIGAIRKAKQAERVSYETAIAVAEALLRESDAQALQRSHDEESRADAELERLLYRVAGTLDRVD